MQWLQKGLKAPKSFVVDSAANKVRVTLTSKPNARSPSRAVLKWTLDFTGVESKHLLALAGRECVILLQRNWRALPDNKAREGWAEKTFNVKEAIVSRLGHRSHLPRKPVKEIVADYLAQMTPEERAAYFAEVQKRAEEAAKEATVRATATVEKAKETAARVEKRKK